MQGEETSWDLGPAGTCPFEGVLESPPGSGIGGGERPQVVIETEGHIEKGDKRERDTIIYIAITLTNCKGFCEC